MNFLKIRERIGKAEEKLIREQSNEADDSRHKRLLCGDGMKKYQIIYADPPWEYKVWSIKGNKRSASQHYQVMSKKDIQNLPIEKISADNAVLFLWVIPPCLEEGLKPVKKM